MSKGNETQIVCMEFLMSLASAGKEQSLIGQKLLLYSLVLIQALWNLRLIILQGPSTYVPENTENCKDLRGEKKKNLSDGVKRGNSIQLHHTV